MIVRWFPGRRREEITRPPASALVTPQNGRVGVVFIKKPCCHSLRDALNQNALRVFLTHATKIFRVYVVKPIPMRAGEPHWLNYCPWCGSKLPTVFLIGDEDERGEPLDAF